jgi:ankyrin repeat protein
MNDDVEKLFALAKSSCVNVGDMEKLSRFLQKGDYREIISAAEAGSELACAFVHAARIGELDAVKTFFENGIQIDVKNDNFMTALTSSCMGNNIEVAMFLLENNADINAQDSYNNTPLIHAAYCESVDIVRLLLERGANIDLEDVEGFTALHFSCQYHYMEQTQLLLQYNPDINIKNNQGKTALDFATSEEIRNMLLNYVPSTNYILK